MERRVTMQKIATSQIKKNLKNQQKKRNILNKKNETSKATIIRSITDQDNFNAKFYPVSKAFMTHATSKR